MKKKITLYSLLIFLIGCGKKNEYFATNEIYNTVIQSVDKIHNEISKTDKVFYVFNRYDTLIIMSTEKESTLRPTYNVEKIGYFKYKNNKVIVAKPYKPKFELITGGKKLNYIDNDLKPPYYDGNDYQKGMVYKIIDVKHLKLIDKGKLMKYFKPMADYENLPPQPPTN